MIEYHFRKLISTNKIHRILKKIYLQFVLDFIVLYECEFIICSISILQNY